MILILFSKIKYKGTSLFPFFLSSVHASGEVSAGHVGTRASCNGNAGRRECERANASEQAGGGWFISHFDVVEPNIEDECFSPFDQNTIPSQKLGTEPSHRSLSPSSKRNTFKEIGWRHKILRLSFLSHIIQEYARRNREDNARYGTR